MNLFKKNIDSNHVVKDTLNKIDDSTLTMQERADKSAEFQERLGITASSKTRRFVTWFLLIFISSWFVTMALIHVVISPDMSQAMFTWIKEYCSNAVIITIVSFFYGGYYLNKIVSPQAKERLDKKRQQREMEQKRFDLEVKKEARETEIKLNKKEERIQRRNERRDRRKEV